MWLKAICFVCKKITNITILNDYNMSYIWSKWKNHISDSEFENLEYNPCDCCQTDTKKSKQQLFNSKCMNKIDPDVVNAPVSVVHMLMCKLWHFIVDKFNNWRCKQCSQLYCSLWVLENIKDNKPHWIVCDVQFSASSVYRDLSVKRFTETLKYKPYEKSTKECFEHGLDAIAYWEPCQEALWTKCLIDNKTLKAKKRSTRLYRSKTRILKFVANQQQKKS